MPKHKTSRKGGHAKGSRQGTRAAAPQRQVVFAPWRLEFILSDKDKGCFLCDAARLPEHDLAAWKKMLLLYRDEHALIIMNRYPYTGGHLLVAPRRHTADYAGLQTGESDRSCAQTQLCVAALQRVMKPHGFNVGMNLGKAAGAGIEEHLHWHVIPRWNGDTNFWPVIGGTHTVPVALEQLWDELKPVFDALAANGK